MKTIDNRRRPRLAALFAVALAAGLMIGAADPVLAQGASGPAAQSATEPMRSAATVQALTATPGIDVSSWQGTINWTSVHNAGIQYAYIKATEGTDIRDPKFNANYPAAYYAGLIRGAYHLARPNLSSGSTQANYLASNGGAWSADDQTLPAALDIEPNPYSGGYCYGLTQSGMINWISSFVNQYYARTGRWAVIHTTLSFWKICTGNYTGFSSHDPLSIINWNGSPGLLPGGWGFYTFWQSTDCQPVSGIAGCADATSFNGARDRLVALANNT